MSNPVFDRINKDMQQGRVATAVEHNPMSTAQLQDMYNQPAAGPVQRGVVTYDDVMMKSMTLFGLMLATAIASWVYVPKHENMMMPLFLVGIFGTLALGLVIAFKKTISVPLIITYALLEGVLVGTLSAVVANYAPAGSTGGIDAGNTVKTAIIATLCVFGAMFLGYRSGFIKVNNKTRRIFGMAILGYMLFALVNMVAGVFFTANDGWGLFARGGVVSILISLFAVGLASYSLAVDFDDINNAVAAQLPEKYSWLLAHGLLVTVVWLYIEILRLLQQFRD